MDINAIAELVSGKIISNIDNSIDIQYGLSSDLMSDVLTLEVENAMLITGLSNLQTIRTAEMSDIHCVLIARNKQVSDEMLELARQNKIVIIQSPYGMFRVSGILYQNGIKPIY